MSSSITVGSIAPDFTLMGIPSGTYSLGSYLGKVVVLAFYPADNSPVCSLQMRSYSLEVAKFTQMDAIVLGISPQSTKSHEGFIDKNQILIPLLSDERKEVGLKYGVIGPLGFYRRSIFVIDKCGVVAYAKRTTAGLTYSPTKVLFEAINNASGNKS